MQARDGRRVWEEQPRVLVARAGRVIGRQPLALDVPTTVAAGQLEFGLVDKQRDGGPARVLAPRAAAEPSQTQQ